MMVKAILKSYRKIPAQIISKVPQSVHIISIRGIQQIVNVKMYIQ